MNAAPGLKYLGKSRSWLIFLVVLHAIVIAAGFIAPYSPTEQDRDHPYIRPSGIHFFDTSGAWHARPFIYGTREKAGAFGEYESNTMERLPLQFFITGAHYRLLGFARCSTHLFGVDNGRVNLLGTDGYGRDLLSRILFGGQTSLFTGLLAATIALSLGVITGVLAGFFGGWVDGTAMRLAELCLALPWIYLLFALRAFLPLSVSAVKAFFLIVMAIGTLGWARPARLIRGAALSAKERDFVRAARGFGASNFYLMRKHVLPQMEPIVLTQAAILVPQFVLAEVTLSFLGLGIPEPTPSWGNLLTSLQQYSVLTSYWWMYLPAVAMVPFFIGYLSLSSSLQYTSRTAKIDP
jgi:peptide/nickel transport system permease protein